MICSNTAVYGENEYGKSGHLSISTFWSTKNNDAFEVQFSGLHLYTLLKTLITCRAMQFRLKKKRVSHWAANACERSDFWIRQRFVRVRKRLQTSSLTVFIVAKSFFVVRIHGLRGLYDLAKGVVTHSRISWRTVTIQYTNPCNELQRSWIESVPNLRPQSRWWIFFMSKTRKSDIRCENRNSWSDSL